MMGTSQSPSLSRRTRVTGPRALLRMAWASSRPLTFVGVAMLPLSSGYYGKSSGRRIEWRDEA
jgi:hypothetical protein